MKKYFSYGLVIAGLCGLLVALPWWLSVNVTELSTPAAVIAGGCVPLALLYICLRRTRNWSGITALTMIPTSTLGVMDIVANLGDWDSGSLIAILSIVVFLAALDAGRRIAA